MDGKQLRYGVYIPINLGKHGTNLNSECFLPRKLRECAELPQASEARSGRPFCTNWSGYQSPAGEAARPARLTLLEAFEIEASLEIT